LADMADPLRVGFTPKVPVERTVRLIKVNTLY
jgi:hypothetical protein